MSHISVNNFDLTKDFRIPILTSMVPPRFQHIIYITLQVKFSIYCHNLSYFSLKPCAIELAPVISKFFQLSSIIGIFPSSWKLVHAFPIYQKGDKSEPSSYHPIVITSLISKTMETILIKQLLAFLETNNLFSDHQYDFQQSRSTGDLLAYAVNVWSSALESYGESRVFSLDV